MKANHIILFSVLFIVKLCAASNPGITIRPVALADFDAIRELSIRTFGQAYGYTTTEQFDSLRILYNKCFDNEIADMQTLGNHFVGFVACHNNLVVGYLSAQDTATPNTIYGRFAVVEPTYKRGIFKMLMAQILRERPETEQIFCCTSRKNPTPQAFYMRNGGKPTSMDHCAPYLQKALDPANYVAFVFDKETINAGLTKHLSVAQQ